MSDISLVIKQLIWRLITSKITIFKRPFIKLEAPYNYNPLNNILPKPTCRMSHNLQGISRIRYVFLSISSGGAVGIPLGHLCSSKKSHFWAHACNPESLRVDEVFISPRDVNIRSGISVPFHSLAPQRPLLGGSPPACAYVCVCAIFFGALIQPLSFLVLVLVVVLVLVPLVVVVIRSSGSI